MRLFSICFNSKTKKNKKTKAKKQTKRKRKGKGKGKGKNMSAGYKPKRRSKNPRKKALRKRR